MIKFNIYFPKNSFFVLILEDEDIRHMTCFNMFQDRNSQDDSVVSSDASLPEASQASLNSPVLGSNIASPPGNTVPSEAAANAVASEPLAPATDSPVEAAPTTMANAVVERWDEMATNQGDIEEPMHVERL